MPVSAQPATLRIGALARASGVPVRTIRFYEAAGLVAPDRRTDAGYRLFAPDAVDRLRFIRRAQALGLSLADIRKVLTVRDGGRPPCADLRDLISRQVSEVDRRMERLAALRRDLLHIRHWLDSVMAHPSPDAPDCHCIQPGLPDVRTKE